MKLTLIALLALCLCVVGCATLKDVGKHLRGADSQEGQSPDKQAEPIMSPTWTSNSSDPNNVLIEGAIRSDAKKPTGELTKVDLEKVRELHLVDGNTPVTEVPKELEKLTNLRTLWLNDNQLTDVPKGLEKLTQLRKLTLYDNKLTNVKGLEKLTQLTTLYLSNNRLTDVKGLEKLTKLEDLRLQDNPDLTKAQIDELQKALPNCKIISNPTENKWISDRVFSELPYRFEELSTSKWTRDRIFRELSYRFRDLSVKQQENYRSVVQIAKANGQVIPTNPTEEFKIVIRNLELDQKVIRVASANLVEKLEQLDKIINKYDEPRPAMALRQLKAELKPALEGSVKGFKEFNLIDAAVMERASRTAMINVSRILAPKRDDEQSIRRAFPAKPLTKEESAKVIEVAIREQINKPTGELTKIDLEKVNRLVLRNPKITDVTALGKLTNLSELDLTRNSIVDVSPLAKLTLLWSLRLNDSPLGDISALESLTNLEYLDISQMQLNDDDLRHLSRLKYIRHLSLRDNHITDAGLIELTNLRQLRNLFLHKTKVTKAGVARLQKALPKCNIGGNPTK